MEAHESCSLFEKCECNRCPLHPNFTKLDNSAEDVGYYHKCRASKKNRMKIASEYGLKNKGLFPKEKLMMDKWENMPESEKQAIKARLAKNSPFLQLKAKGYGIVRVGKDSPELTLAKQEDSPYSCVKIPLSEYTTQNKLEDDAHGK